MSLSVNCRGSRLSTCSSPKGGCLGPGDDDVGHRLHPGLDQEVGVAEAGFGGDVGGDHRPTGLQRMAFRGPFRGLGARLADHAGWPADAGAHQEGLPVRLHLHHLGEVGAKRLADQAAGFGEDLVQVVGAKGQLAEARQGGLLSKLVGMSARSMLGAVLVNVVLMGCAPAPCGGAAAWPGGRPAAGFRRRERDRMPPGCGEERNSVARQCDPDGWRSATPAVRR